MKLLNNITIWLIFIKDEFIERRIERKMKKKYSGWNSENWIGDLEFIWGIKSYTDLSKSKANIHTLNDIEIDYDHESNKYWLSIETAYLFKNKLEECEYLRWVLCEIEKYIDSNNIEKDYPDGLFMKNIGITMKAETIGELYWDFKLYVNGFCSLYEEE